MDPRMRGHPYMDDIVTDDCSAAFSRHVPSHLSPHVSPSYSRSDSGYHHQDYLQQKDQHHQQLHPSEKQIPYQRLDSGFCSQMNSLSLGTEPSQIIGESQDQEFQNNKHSDQFFEELFTQDHEGDTQLHLAIASNYEDVFNAIVRLAPKPEYLNIQNNELWAPLHIAVLTNQPTMVRKLVVAGATTQIVDQEGNTPLHHACSRGFLACAENLLKPISREEVQDSALCLEQNYLHQVLDMTNHKGEHCLHLATFGKHYDIIRFLCFKGANMNVTEGRSGKTALHYAVNMRDHELVEFLAGPRSRGCCQVDLDTKDWSGRTAIQCAMINGDDYIQAVLESLGADTTAVMDSEDNDDDEEYDAYRYNDCGSRILESQA